MQLLVMYADFTRLGAGYETCAGYPASLGYETVDAQAFAEWGIDCTSALKSRFG